MASTVGIVFSSMNEENVPELTKVRSMGSIPIGGRYRLVDFALSNMVNSGITTVGMITKNNYQSLMDHLGSGKYWDLSRKEGGLILLPPYSGETETLYKNRLEAVKGATAFLKKCKEDFVVLADSDAVYKLDYSKVIDYHISKNADITLVYHEHEAVKSHYYITLNTADDGRVSGVEINPVTNGVKKNYINVMVARTSFLLRLIQDAIQLGHTSFGRDILSPGVSTLNLYAYKLEGYYSSITSLPKYFSTNFDLLEKSVRSEIFGDRAVYTKVNDSAPAKFAETAKVKNSLISDGCVIEGTVENCILFRGVKIGRGSVVKNCIIMTDNIVGENCNLAYVVSDKNSVIRDNRLLAGCEIQPYFINKSSLI
ncbi:MAG: glucose-1-phosphate adenylyltransferase subunit GlgD [Clostridia bacterium]|jgi:glucose-1-phosphate adenylyltransferase|nr:glucose-1-phosphate adenylyltransferase subunit GlgD [Clostridia bacterium]